jgi:hypothetical protein
VAERKNIGKLISYVFEIKNMVEIIAKIKNMAELISNMAEIVVEIVNRDGRLR